MKCAITTTREVKAEAGSSPFSVEAGERKSYRFRIDYLTWRVTWQKSFVHFPMWI